MVPKLYRDQCRNLCLPRKSPVVPKSPKFHADGLFQMPLNRLQSSSASYASLLRSCCVRKSLSDGKRIHSNILRSGLERNVLLGSLLVQIYGDCVSLEDACAVFGKMHQRNAFTWNVMIKASAQQGEEKAALRLFEQMQLEGVMPDRVTFIGCLSACASHGAADEGKWIHSLIVIGGFDKDAVLGTALISMYGKCGNLDNAQRMFEMLPVQSVISWNAIIAAYVQNEQGKKALELLQQMQLDGVKASRVTFVSILDACASQAAQCDGKWLHALVMISGFESDVTMANALVTMYGKCGSLEDAQKTFNKVQEQNVVSWNAIITVYAQMGQGIGALPLFEQMQQESVMPNKVTFVSILSAFSSQDALADSRRMHALIAGSEFGSDVVVGNSLVNMYANCDSLESGQRMFDSMPAHNVVSWNAIISLTTQHGQGKKAMELFEQLQLKGAVPNKVTFINILSACANQADLAVGEHVHALILKNSLQSDPVVGTALVSMYGKCSRLEDARNIFDRIHTEDIVPWNAMIAAYAQNRHSKEALDLFNQMQVKGINGDKITFLRVLDACTTLGALPDGKQIHVCIVDLGCESDIAVGTALLDMYGKCHSILDARRIFDQMSEQNVITWTAMITAYVQNDRGREACQLLCQMQCTGVQPNKVTFVSIVDVCASQAALAEGEHTHAVIVGNGFERDIMVGTALVNMYGKCGKIEESRRMFDLMPERNVISWNAMVAAYAQSGLSCEAIQLSEQMQWKGVLPDEATFISILSACSHMGMVMEGCDCFVAMVTDYGITPCVDHYNCLIDLLGRAGQLEEAEGLVRSMPLEPNVASFMTLLSACRYRVDMDRGERAAKEVFQLKAGKASPYIVLSSIFESAAREEDAQKILSKRRTQDPIQQSGYSSVKVNNSFFLGNEVHLEEDRFVLSSRG